MPNIGLDLKKALEQATQRPVVFVADFRVLDQPNTLNTDDKTVYVHAKMLTKDPMDMNTGIQSYTIEYRVWLTHIDVLKGESILDTDIFDLKIGNTDEKVEFIAITSDTGTVIKGATVLDCRATFTYVPVNYNNKQITELQAKINGFGVVIKKEA